LRCYYSTLPWSILAKAVIHASPCQLLCSSLCNHVNAADADSWLFGVLWAAREAIEAANPWDHQAAFAATPRERTMYLCVVINTTCGRTLHIMTAGESPS
jgi:hypothetical protein